MYCRIDAQLDLISSTTYNLPLLVGAGVRGVSVACARIDETRYRLRRLDATACAEVFGEALRLRDADETAAFVRQRIGEAQW